MQTVDANLQPLSGTAAPARSGEMRNRLIALPLFVVTLAISLTAYALTPDPDGYGTHEQLGMAPCGFMLYTGLPCATCGMTTSFSYAAHGHLVSSFVTQPAGALLSLATAMMVIVSGWSLCTGMTLAPLGKALTRARVVIPALVFFGLSWGYTITAQLLAVQGG